MARPIEYNPDIVVNTQKYIDGCEDTYTQIGTPDKPAWRKEVKLPSVEGLAYDLGVNKTTLYEWSKTYPEFSNVFEKLHMKQGKVLINKGLSGEYTSPISKLLLMKHGYVEESKSDITTGGEKIQSAVLPELIAEADRLLKEKKLNG